MSASLQDESSGRTLTASQANAFESPEVFYDLEVRSTHLQRALSKVCEFPQTCQPYLEKATQQQEFRDLVDLGADGRHLRRPVRLIRSNVGGCLVTDIDFDDTKREASPV